MCNTNTEMTMKNNPTRPKQKRALEKVMFKNPKPPNYCLEIRSLILLLNCSTPEAER